LEHLHFLADSAAPSLRAAWEQEMQSRAAYALESRLATLQKLLEGSRQLSQLLPRQVLLQLVSQIARDSLAHDYGAIWTVVKDQGMPVASLALDWWPGASQRPPRLGPAEQESILADLLADRQPAGIGPYASLLLAPILTPTVDSAAQPTDMWGLLVIAAQPPGCYGPEHATLLQVLAAQLGVALENARLYHDVLETQEQLKQSQAELVQASKLSAIGQLAAGVAHELNSPLGAIALSLDNLQIFAPDINTDAQEQVANADQALRNAQRIVDHLLAYSRKSMEQQRVPVDLNGVCLSALDLSSAQIEKRGVRVTLTSPPEKVQVQAVALELQQVVVNLLLNATQAYDGKPGKIALEVFQAPLGRGIRVTDWAGGVPEALVGKIFDPFFTTKPVGKGTGLGLSISQEIVGKFDGRIELQNRPGVGSSFAVVFPN
jgi:signal transduction histidine kinase